MTVYYDYSAETKLHIPYKKITERVIEAVLKDRSVESACEVSVSVVDNDRIRSINKEFRNIDRSTDVLSFPMNEPFDYTEFNPVSGELSLGDVVISAEKVISQAEEYGHTRTREYAFLICHSILHLLGYDHMEDDEREEMEELQRNILSGLGYKR